MKLPSSRQCHTLYGSHELLTTFRSEIVNLLPLSSRSGTLGFSSIHQIKFSSEKCHSNDDQVKETVVKGLVGEFYDTDIQKLDPRIQKCIELEGSSKIVYYICDISGEFH